MKRLVVDLPRGKSAVFEDDHWVLPAGYRVVLDEDGVVMIVPVRRWRLAVVLSGLTSVACLGAAVLAVVALGAALAASWFVLCVCWATVAWEFRS